MEDTNKLLEKVTGISISDYALRAAGRKKLPNIRWKSAISRKLLVWKNGSIQDSHFGNLPEFLPTKSFADFQQHESNPAPGFIFRKKTGGQNRNILPRPRRPVRLPDCFSNHPLVHLEMHDRQPEKNGKANCCAKSSGLMIRK